MSGRRLAIAAAVIGLAALAVHRLGRRSGTTGEEVRARLPGDELVPHPLWDSTRAMTIEASPGDVWPWIAQMLGYPAWSVFFTVAALEPEHALVLQSTRHLLKPMRTIDFSWAFVLAPSGAWRTRLLFRARARCEPAYAGTLLGPVIGVGD